MFTGLVEEVGRIASLRRSGDALRLGVDAPRIAEGLERGDSVAVNGVCLTAALVRDGSFEADVVGETRRRTYLERLRPGSPVNLERALRAGDRMGGHMVQGHVDGVGRVVSLRPAGTGKILTVLLPEGTERYVVEKGSIAVDGTSLTVAEREGRIARIALVPETLAETVLGKKVSDDPVHIEVDVIAKYVESLLPGGGRSPDWYRENGYG
ncbi:MAG: riboflavin synthase [Candidatus Eisenbacteria bacterium]|nr:riboflavin synthase [Candidatus Eisenbacteria bacterium]